MDKIKKKIKIKKKDKKLVGGKVLIESFSPYIMEINNFPNFVSSAKGEFPYDANCWSSL